MNLFKKNKIRTVLENDVLVYSPVKNGKGLKLSSLRDGIFSLKGLGDGITIDVEDDFVDIISPVDGELRVVYPHGNSYGIMDKDGHKIIIHIGTEHSHLRKDYAKHFAKQGDTIKRGQKIATINMKYMKENSTITSSEQVIIVVPSGEEIINKHKGKLTKETNIFEIRKRK